ncbi:MAG: MFS transporter [Candidatus Methanomethylicia archaeon]|nr:MFS transporter [Candidatus Methanomethylicia archaeon]MDW7988625.1 MFS transporter [Nitrososphaerota archaeon]
MYKCSSIWIFLSIVHFINDFITSLIPAIIITLKYEWNLSYFDQGLLMTASTIFMVLLQVFTGYLADRIHFSKIIFLCVFMLGFGTLLMGLSFDFKFFLISVCIMSFGASFTHPTIYSMTTNQYVDFKGRFLSFVSASGDLSLPIVFALTEFLSEATNWRFTLLSYGFTTIILSVILKYFTSNIVVKSQFQYKLKLNFRSIIEILKVIFIPLTILSVMAACYRITLTFTTTYLNFIGLSKGQANYIFALTLFGGFLGPTLTGLLFKSGSETRVIIFGLFSMSIFSLLIAFTKSIPLTILLLIFLLMFMLGTWPLIYSIASSNALKGVMGLTYGVLLTSSWFFSSIGPIIVGFLADLFGVWIIYLIMCLLFMFAGLISLKFHFR